MPPGFLSVYYKTVFRTSRFDLLTEKMGGPDKIGAFYKI